MKGAGNSGRCGVCATRLVKNGRTAAGTQRWLCPLCRSSSVRRRPDVTRAAQLEGFLGWLMSPTTQRAHDSSARTFRRVHAWCWNVEPVIAITGEIYDQIQLDGTYLSGGWCLLVAIDGATGTVIAWQWCDTEKRAAWVALLERIPPPRVVVTDGGSGLASALRACWPDTLVQRCLVHVQRNICRDLTRQPRTDAGRTLRAITLALTRITTREEAAAWEVRLHQWHQIYTEMINTKTYLRQVGVRPSWARQGATWWWTHDRLRRAYRLLERLTRQGVLFTYLHPTLDGLDIASTTNRIEGGTNHPIKDLLRRHRGMSQAHRRRAVEWWCYQHSTLPAPPVTLIRPEHYTPTPATPVETDDDGITPDGYGTSTTAEDGLWARKGWAGHSR